MNESVNAAAHDGNRLTLQRGAHPWSRDIAAVRRQASKQPNMSKQPSAQWASVAAGSQSASNATRGRSGSNASVSRRPSDGAATRGQSASACRAAEADSLAQTIKVGAKGMNNALAATEEFVNEARASLRRAGGWLLQDRDADAKRTRGDRLAYHAEWNSSS